MSRCWPSALATILAFFALSLPAAAHEVQPAIAELSFAEDTYRVDLSLNIEALLAGIDPESHGDTTQSANSDRYEALRAQEPDELQTAVEAFTEELLTGVALKADGVRVSPEIIGIEIPEVGSTDLPRESVVVLAGELPPGTRTVTWQWAAAFGPSVVLAGESGADDEFSSYLGSGEESAPIPIADRSSQPIADVAANYLQVGFTHIVPKGLDHILFVVGLFLLTPRLHPLAWQISAFTVAHTLTLALASLGIISISPAIVEPLIALSIVYVAVENLFTNRLHAWRPLIVFGFGLLHGLGFAGVLADIGFAPSRFVISLIAFNVGVELGQLAVIAVCFLAVGLWFSRKAWYRAAISIPASLIVAAVGAFWFIERVT